MRVLLTGEGLRQEVSWTLKGRKRFHDMTVEAVRDNARNIVGITGAAMEITERKRLEEEVLQISERNSAGWDRTCTTGFASIWPGSN